MQKLILTVMLAIFSAGLFAQSMDDIKKYVVLQKWQDAKGQIDKFLASDKNAKNPEAWYYKGYVYAQLGGLPSYAGTDIRMTAFEAYKKYQELDPKNAMMKDNENVELFGLYNAYFDTAIAKYNNKKYNEAFGNFKNALTVEEYIKNKNYSYKGYSYPALDTQLIQNTALSAYLGKDSVNAAMYYQKLADAKIKGNSYLEIYQFLVDYFSAKGDIADKNKYFEIGRGLYPENDYWADFELREAGNDRQKKEQVLAKYPTNYSIYYNYAAELFNAIYTSEKKPDDYAALQAKLEEIVKKAIAIKSGPEANLLMARHLYNVVYDLQDAMAAVKGNKPDDVKKRNDLTAQMNSKFDEMLSYATTVFNMYDGKSNLKSSEKGNYKVATNLILSYWEYKKDAAKIKLYQEKMKSTD